MSRLGKYMVFNPQQDKPKVYYSAFDVAMQGAKEVSAKTGQDVLVMQIVGKVETKIEQNVKVYNEHKEV